MNCDHCGRDLARLPYTCTKCGGEFCPKHRLPESHDCIVLKVEKAERSLKREQGKSAGPWFKNEFRLSNVDEQPACSSEQEQTYPADKPPETKAACQTCGKKLLNHEIAGCPHCGEPLCGEHAASHRRDCTDRDGKSDEQPASKPACETCGGVLLDAEIVSCEYCGRTFCREHASDHERTCGERPHNEQIRDEHSGQRHWNEPAVSIENADTADSGFLRRQHGRSRWIVGLLLVVILIVVVTLLL